MEENNLIIDLINIEKRIFTIRGKQVMIDSHLAELFKVEVKALNQGVKRNMDRFPESFRFQITKIEFENLRSQIVTSSLREYYYLHDTIKKVPPNIRRDFLFLETYIT